MTVVRARELRQYKLRGSKSRPRCCSGRRSSEDRSRRTACRCLAGSLSRSAYSTAHRTNAGGAFFHSPKRISRCAWSGGLKSMYPSAVEFPASLEAINALLRTEGSSPGVVPHQAELSTTDGATSRCSVPRTLRAVAHLRLLCVSLVGNPRSLSHVTRRR
jgi:hypothetical protein